MLLMSLLTELHRDPYMTMNFMVPNGVISDADFFIFEGLKRALLGVPKWTIQSNQGKPGAVLRLCSKMYHMLCYNMLIMKEWLEVGLVANNNKLCSLELHRGGKFAFSKSLVNFQANKDTKQAAIAIAAFGSANAQPIDKLVSAVS